MSMDEDNSVHAENQQGSNIHEYKPQQESANPSDTASGNISRLDLTYPSAYQANIDKIALQQALNGP